MSLTAIPDGFNPTVGGSLDLRSLTAIPDGFNPTVGGSLYLMSLTAIPDGFNPTVGGNLDLSALTAIPDGFNPTVGGDLYLSALTAIPDGFNPTVGGDLYLSALTAIPDGFNPTVGGYLELKNSSKYIGATVNEVKVNRNYFWDKDGKRYAIIDGIFCEIITEKSQTINGEEYKIYGAARINKDVSFIIVNCNDIYAHAETLHKAIEDLQFKIQAERFKKEPILPDTVITMNHYRIITGACELGCKSWMKENNITTDSISAQQLLPMLEKTNAYGFQKFKQLYKA